MKKINSQISIFYTLFFILIFNSCTNKTSREFQVKGMFMNNPQHTARYDSSPILEQPRLLWKVKTDGQVMSSPVVVDDMVYVGSGDNRLYAIDAHSGEVKWQFETGAPVHSTPLVAQGKVFFLSYDGYFYALNRQDGRPVWKFKTGGESVFKVKDYFNGSFQPDFWDFFLSSPAAKDDMIFFGSSDANVYALDMKTGEKIWSYKTGRSIHSSPAIWKNSLVIGSWDSKVYCLDTETGAKKWSYTTGRDTTRYIWLGVQGSPSVSDGVAYIGSRDAKFYAFDIETGDTLWTQNDFNRSWMPSSAAISDSAIYTGSSDAFSFFSLDKKTGKINYSTNTKAYTFSSPAIDYEMAYIGSSNGRLYGIELKSGKIKWEYRTSGSKSDTPGFFNSEGEVNVERARKLSKGIDNMPALTELYKTIFEESGSVLSSPSIFNQVIYFGSCDGYIYAVTDK